MRNLIAFLVSLAFAAGLLAQGADPIGRTDPRAQSLKQVATVDVAALDRPALAAEDVTRANNGMPARFAVPYAVAVTPATDGTWEALDNTWSLWRVRVRAPGASHVNFGFDRCTLPPTARLQIYAADYSDIVRPFDATDPTPSHELWTPVVLGAEVVVEVYLQTLQRPQLDLRIGQIGSGYRFFGAGETAISGQGPEIAGACNIDVACSQGIPWQPQIPAIAVLSSAGSIFCTGFMINNTAQDGRNFLMTAHHCGVTATVAASLVAYWNYQNTVCGGPRNGTLTQFNTGSTLRADYSVSDFTLVELNSAPNPNWGVTYVGWDNTGANATSAVGIHHPQGDVKKISFDNTATQVVTYLGTSSPGDSTHVRVVAWNLGTTEPGSSGSPLFDQNHRVIGQLHGGYAACGNTLSDYYGRFARSWTGGGSNSTRLSNWLDPLGLGSTTLDTHTAVVATATAYGTGCYESFATFHEDFPAGAFDLYGTAVTPSALILTPAGTGYAVTRTTGSWFNSTSANLGLADDAVTSAITLPFVFTHPGGSTSSVRMCSNGYIWLNGTSTLADYMPAAATLVSSPARLCPLWMDINPPAAGSTRYDVDPSGTAVYFSWLGVRMYNGSLLSDIQCAVRSNGVVEFRYRGATNDVNVAIVGYSPGNGVLQPDSRDISTSVPFNTATDSPPLTLTPSNRPVIGTTQMLAVQHIPAASPLGAVFAGFAQYNPGLSLASIGMPGCQQYTDTLVQWLFTNPVGTYNFSLPIPNTPSLAGLHLYTAAVVLSSGVNTLGALSSNGVDLKIDVN